MCTYREEQYMSVESGCITYSELSANFDTISQHAQQAPFLLLNDVSLPIAVILSAIDATTIKRLADALKSADISPGITSTPCFIWRENVASERRNVLTKLQYGTATIFMREDAPDVVAIIPLSSSYLNGTIKRLIDDDRGPSDVSTLYDGEAILARLGILMPPTPA